MFSKIPILSKFKNLDADIIDISAIKNDLFSGLFDIMEDSFEQRKMDAANSNYKEEDVEGIINDYARKNMILAAASSIVPGPFGILGSIPELLISFKNQMNMIYDLGCAHGKEDFISKDVLLDIPFAAFGGNTNLSAIQNDGNLLDSSKDLLIGKATKLGENIIEKTLKKSIVQFIPIAGPIVMAAWSKKISSKISKSSVSFLGQTNTYTEHIRPEENDEIRKALQLEKIKGLVNLIESNDEINENQIELLGTIIGNAALSDAEKEHYLSEALKAGSNLPINYDLLKRFEEGEDLIMELIIMAKRSGRVDQFEKNYIYQLGKELKLDSNFIDNLF